MKNQQEIWKNVIGYEGLYEVNIMGDVRRVNFNSLGVSNIYREQNYTLKKRDNGKGYLRVQLSKNNIRKTIMVHRIIAQAFIDNPHNYKVVNHINGIKSDNNLFNLEWCNQSQNTKHAYQTGLRIVTEKQLLACKRNWELARKPKH